MTEHLVQSVRMGGDGRKIARQMHPLCKCRRKLLEEAGRKLGGSQGKGSAARVTASHRGGDVER